MAVWSKELVSVELVPLEESDDERFRSAILRFKTMGGALQAKDMLDGCTNISQDGSMAVEILSGSPSSMRRAVEPTSSGAASRTPPSATSARQASRFTSSYQSENVASRSNGVYPSAHELPNPDLSAHYQALFSPQSPIGNHLTEVNRVSGKTLIANDSLEEDETTSLLNDAVAYADNGATTQRRATAPQVLIGRMSGLSLNTTNPSPGPSSVPQYVGSISAHPGPISPLNGSGPGMPFGMQPYQRQGFPPVNPADQNPPCNTLYVGNLPIDTSEEELKAMFSKQRGYKRLCFRTKQNGPMCFVEFEDVSFATKALHELYGQPLHNSVKGGIRLSFSKNPLGVRSGQPTGQNHSTLAGLNGILSGAQSAFTTANGPPPGLSAPPGLGSSRGTFQPPAPNGHPFSGPGFANAANAAWNVPIYSGSMPVPANVVSPNGLPSNGLTSNGLPLNSLPVNALPPSVLPNGLPISGSLKNSTGNGFPAHMMGR